MRTWSIQNMLVHALMWYGKQVIRMHAPRNQQNFPMIISSRLLSFSMPLSVRRTTKIILIVYWRWRIGIACYRYLTKQQLTCNFGCVLLFNRTIAAMGRQRGRSSVLAISTKRTFFSYLRLLRLFSFVSYKTRTFFWERYKDKVIRKESFLWNSLCEVCLQTIFTLREGLPFRRRLA